jgi:hypothetical protein
MAIMKNIESDSVLNGGAGTDKLDSHGHTRRTFLKVGAAVGALASLGLAGCGDTGGSPAVLGAMKANGSKGIISGAAPAILNVQLPSSGRIDASSVYLLMLGYDATNPANFGYVNLRTGTFVACNNDFTYCSTMSAPLSTLGQNGTYMVPIPAIKSGRLYFAINQNFDQMPSFGIGGPGLGQSNTALYDCFEFDTSFIPNVNATNVDCFSLSYSLTTVDINTKQSRSVGYSQDRASVIQAFAQIASCAPSQQTGNTGIFNLATVKDASGGVVRILAPKAAGLTDWAGATLNEQIQNAQLASHFWDDYINQHCWLPNRKFQCYSKLYNPSSSKPDKTVYYGAVDADGQTLRLFTDAAMSVPYAAAPTLPRPSAPFGVPSFEPPQSGASLYHNVDSGQGPIDWGFLLGGNVAGAGQGAYWGTDPVAMAILISICRGVMHLDNGCDTWTNPALFYQGNGSGVSTSDMPIFYYAKILHEQSINSAAYALSYDDIFGCDPSIYFDQSTPVTLQINDI